MEAKNRAREGESGRELGVGGELGETGRSASGKHVRQALVHLRLPETDTDFLFLEVGSNRVTQQKLGFEPIKSKVSSDDERQTLKVPSF